MADKSSVRSCCPLQNVVSVLENAELTGLVLLPCLLPISPIQFIARDIRWPQAYQAAQPSLYHFHHHMPESCPSHHQAAISPLPLTKQSLDKALIQTAIQIQNGLLEECVRQITVSGLQAFKVRWTETLLTKIWLLNSSEPCDWSVTVMHFSISLSSWSTSDLKKKVKNK